MVQLMNKYYMINFSPNVCGLDVEFHEPPDTLIVNAIRVVKL